MLFFGIEHRAGEIFRRGSNLDKADDKSILIRSIFTILTIFYEMAHFSDSSNLTFCFGYKLDSESNSETLILPLKEQHI